MKKQYVLLLVMLLFLVACNEDGSPVSGFFNTGNLPAQFYDINTERDTVLHTQQGADIRIPKGAIAAKGNRVRLEIKEAYSIEDMVKAGLQTRSGKRALSSGGMISIKATDPGAKMVQSLSIHMPSGNTEAGMQLFSGKEAEDGTIDWVDPQPLSPNRTIDSIAQGNAVFSSNCAPCHHPLHDATGPSLAFIAQRRDKRWLKQFIHNPAKLIAEGDPLANCLYNKWNKTAMTAFPHLTDEELESMYRYLNQVSKNLDPAAYPDFKASFDSCAVYVKAKDELQKQRTVLVRDNGKEVVREMLDTGAHIFIPAANIVVPKHDYSTYYQFTITSFGWYNVDVFVDGLPGYESSVLKVAITGSYSGHTNIYIIVPEARICVEGGLLEGEEHVYGFYTDDGRLPLPQGKQAYIMAFTEAGDRITFGLSAFVTKLENEISISPAVVTKEQMNKTVRELNFKDLSIRAADAKNAGAIRSIDVRLNNIESLKPKGTDCDCYVRDAYTDTADGSSGF